MATKLQQAKAALAAHQEQYREDFTPEEEEQFFRKLEWLEGRILNIRRARNPYAK